MGIIDKEKYFAKKVEMLNFIYCNRDKYGWFTFEIMDDIKEDIFIDSPISRIPMTYQQIFSKFGVFLDKKDIYKDFVKILEDYDFLKGNICEVGAGRYPRLAELVAPKIQTNKGTLTIYDPNVVFDEHKGIKVVKDKFTKSTNIDNIDTLYGLYPCDASVTLAEKAFKEDKNLVLAFCGCDHSSKDHIKWLGKYWAEDFCMDYREKYGKEAEIINWPSTLNNDRPILIRRSSKQKLKTK